MHVHVHGLRGVCESRVAPARVLSICAQVLAGPSSSLCSRLVHRHRHTAIAPQKRGEVFPVVAQLAAVLCSLHEKEILARHRIH